MVFGLACLLGSCYKRKQSFINLPEPLSVKFDNLASRVMAPETIQGRKSMWERSVRNDLTL